MEVGPTLHYMMGGVRVDADTEAATVPGLFACGEVAGGMHGANRLGGNSLSDLIVFGRRAGIGAADFAQGRSGDPVVDDAQVEAVVAEALAPFERDGDENPYDLQHDLQETMQSLVGIIRTGPELEEALEMLGELRERGGKLAVGGGRAYNPGWNLATDLPSMLTVSTAWPRAPCTARRAAAATPGRTIRRPTPSWARSTSSSARPDERGPDAPITITPEPLPEMPPELRALLEEGH